MVVSWVEQLEEKSCKTFHHESQQKLSYKPDIVFHTLWCTMDAKFPHRSEKSGRRDRTEISFWMMKERSYDPIFINRYSMHNIMSGTVLSSTYQFFLFLILLILLQSWFLFSLCRGVVIILLLASILCIRTSLLWIIVRGHFVGCFLVESEEKEKEKEFQRWAMILVDGGKFDPTCNEQCNN